jgi:hypothetical protein
MTSKQIVDVGLVERKLVEALVMDLLPVLAVDEKTVRIWSRAPGKKGGDGGYLEQLEGAGLLEWKTAPTKTCSHVTAESGGRQSTLPGTFKE